MVGTENKVPRTGSGFEEESQVQVGQSGAHLLRGTWGIGQLGPDG
jgi:hypothetical protein